MKITLLAVVLICQVALSSSLTCYDCTNLVDKDYCTNELVCTQGADTCYALTATKSEGSVFYNLGCGFSDPSGCTCTKGLECRGDMECCMEDKCNSKGLREGEIAAPPDTPGPTDKPLVTEEPEPNDVRIQTESPDDSNKNYAIPDNSTSLEVDEPEIDEGASTGKDPNAGYVLVPSVVLFLITVLSSF